MDEDGGWGAAVGLEVVEVLGPEGLVVCPPGGEDPGMGSGFGEVFGNLEGCRGCEGGVRGQRGVGGVVFGCGVGEISQGVTAVAGDPVKCDSDPPSTEGVESSLDASGFDPVHISAWGVGGAGVDGILAVREDGVAGWRGFLPWEGGNFADAVGEPLCPGVGNVEVGWQVVCGFEDHPDCCGNASNLSADVRD